MNLRLTGLLVLSVTLFGIGCLVYFNNRHRLVNKLFALFASCISGWVFFGYLVYGQIFEDDYNIVWQRLVFVFGCFLATFLYLLCRTFPDEQSMPKDKITLSIASFGIVFAVISLVSPLIVQDVVQRDILSVKIVYGPLYKFFGIYFLASFVAGIVYLTRKLRTCSGKTKLQLQYFFLGAIIPASVAVTTNLVIPLIFKTSALSPYGRYASLIFVVTIAHAIVRHRLMDIKVVIQKGTVYVCAVAVTAVIFIGLARILSSVEAYAFGNIPLGAAVSLAVIVAIFFQPLKRWIQGSMNRYFYRETYDFQRTVRETSQRLNMILDLQSLLNYIGDAIEKTLKVEMVAVYMRDDPLQAFARRVLKRAVEWSRSGPAPVLPATAAFVAFFEREKRPLVSDDAGRDPGNLLLASAVKELRTMGGEIALPFIQDHAVSGLLVIGPKLSGDPYFAEDIDLLSTLSSQAGISVKNAQLYREVTLANEYIENILAAMESGVIAVNSDRRITLCNRVAERMMGRSAEDLRLVPMAHLPAPLAHPLDATLADGQPRLQIEIILPDASGRLIPMACSTSALHDASGNVQGAVAVFSDLSRVKELEGEKRRAERLAAFGALASGIAHEIKNPLVAIKTFAELIPERYADADFRENFSKVAIKEIMRIDELVARLRGLSAPTEQILRPMDIRGPIEETLTLLAGQLEQKRITVRRLYAEPLPVVGAHEPSLKQLFLNLFMNSLDAMEDGGELTVKLTRRWRYGAPTLLVEISDTGSGVQEAMLDRIFAPFVTTKARGSGLGLAICRGIADAHRATIHAENNLERPGLTMAIEFPAIEGTLAVA